VARAIGKNEEEVAVVMMSQIRDRYNPIEPPAISSDGNDSYPEAMLEIWVSCLNIQVEEDLQHKNNRNPDGNAFK